MLHEDMESKSLEHVHSLTYQYRMLNEDMEVTKTRPQFDMPTSHAQWRYGSH